jgi:hypothetical protein
MHEPGRTATVTTPSDRQIRSTTLFHTTEERDGMLRSGMDEGVQQSYAALDRLLASPS